MVNKKEQHKSQVRENRLETMIRVIGKYFILQKEYSKKHQI